MQNANRQKHNATGLFTVADDTQKESSESEVLTADWHVGHQCERVQHQTPCSQGGVWVPRQHCQETADRCWKRTTDICYVYKYKHTFVTEAT